MIVSEITFSEDIGITLEIFGWQSQLEDAFPKSLHLPLAQQAFPFHPVIEPKESKTLSLFV